MANMDDCLSGEECGLFVDHTNCAGHKISAESIDMDMALTRLGPRDLTTHDSDDGIIDQVADKVISDVEGLLVAKIDHHAGHEIENPKARVSEMELRSVGDKVVMLNTFRDLMKTNVRAENGITRHMLREMVHQEAKLLNDYCEIEMENLKEQLLAFDKSPWGRDGQIAGARFARTETAICGLKKPQEQEQGGRRLRDAIAALTERVEALEKQYSTKKSENVNK
ncbi:hypothetical protein N658DRAFT_527775 [Parathielavia hyrcaniae]|uniref:Uncharacterized protein n=1 Tax=Parathielavia hyrcaniae TaxID=113614 RepID=A0AAN6SX91_9PEZI|nr:hypothetical protein N658DRAFT_527775 [Parathielavia hyrcaniae]